MHKGNFSQVSFLTAPETHMVPAGIKSRALGKNSAIVAGVIEVISSLLLYSKSPPCLKTCPICRCFLWQINSVFAGLLLLSWELPYQYHYQPAELSPFSVLFFYQFWPGELCKLIVLFIFCVYYVRIFCILYFCRPILIYVEWCTFAYFHVQSAVFLYYF